jgi:hypothetical protein
MVPSAPAKWRFELIANGYEPARYTVVPNSEHMVIHLKKSPKAGMFSSVVLILFLVAVSQAREATEIERALVKGSVILNGEGGPGVANVQITDSAHTGGPWATSSDGGFTLDYPNRGPGERVRLGVIKDGLIFFCPDSRYCSIFASPSFMPKPTCFVALAKGLLSRCTKLGDRRSPASEGVS